MNHPLQYDPYEDPYKNKIFINYLYFGVLLTFTLLLSLYNVLLIHSPISTRIFFLLYSFGQNFLEIGIMIFMGYLIRRTFSRKVFLFFIAGTFLYFLTHPLDFIMDRLLDLSFWDTADLIFDESLDNFIQLLHASDVPLFMWALFGIIVCMLPLVGVGFYKITEHLTCKKPLLIHHDQFMQTIFCIPIGLFLWDLSASPIVNPNIYHSFLKSLPWKRTFIQPANLTIETHYNLKKIPPEKEAKKIANEMIVHAENKPNIYFFIIESLRRDFITPEVAPHLAAFEKDNISFDLSLSNANYTQNSWFSIFHSNFPFYWAHVKHNWSSGSIPLRVLKKLGYKIHVFSSAELSYYSMDEVLFGKEHHLADAFHMFPHHYPIRSAETDLRAMQSLQENLSEKNNSGNVYIVFLDSTHFDYSWGKDHPIKFKPVADQMDYFKAHHSNQNIESIRNRYRNAINYVDTLFANFLQDLKKKKLYDSSIILITGDHGEEFYDQGKLFHASHLAHVQTSVPIYYKFEDNKKREIPSKEMTSHIDIFPSIIDYVCGSCLDEGLWNGDSIFNANKWPYIVTARYNASRAPYEFFIHNGKKKIVLQFKNRKNIFQSKELQIISFKDHADKNLSEPGKKEKTIRKQFRSALHRIFSP